MYNGELRKKSKLTWTFNGGVRTGRSIVRHRAHHRPCIPNVPAIPSPFFLLFFIDHPPLLLLWLIYIYIYILFFRRWKEKTLDLLCRHLTKRYTNENKDTLRYKRNIDRSRSCFYNKQTISKKEMRIFPLCKRFFARILSLFHAKDIPLIRLIWAQNGLVEKLIRQTFVVVASYGINGASVVAICQLPFAIRINN